MEVAYHWFGGEDRDAWRNGEPLWYNFEYEHKPQYKKIVDSLQQMNMKFRFSDVRS